MVKEGVKCSRKGVDPFWNFQPSWMYVEAMVGISK